MRKIMALIILSLIGSTAMAGPLLVPTTEDVEFGIAPTNSHVYKKIVLKSEGDTPVMINSIKTFCNCITIPFPKDPIAPGDSVVLEVHLETLNQPGNKRWGMHIKYNRRLTARFKVQANITDNVQGMEEVYVFPHMIVASQYGSSDKSSFGFEITNKTEKHIPLKLVYSDYEFYDLDFPVFIEPNSTAEGNITLNEKGLESSFEKTIIFEFINTKSEKKLYSIPIKRKIYKSQNNDE